MLLSCEILPLPALVDRTPADYYETISFTTAGFGLCLASGVRSTVPDETLRLPRVTVPAVAHPLTNARLDS
jgi:hypothetical protein